jgi:hypothetical protein
LYQPKGATGRLDSASPAQNPGFPAAYRNQIDIDPQAQQRLLHGIQQHMASINSASSAASNTANSFPSQNTHHSNHQQQLIQQQAALAAAQKQIQQQQIHGQQSQLPNFMPNHYNYSETNANSQSEGNAPSETSTTTNLIAELINNAHIKQIVGQAQRHAAHDLIGLFSFTVKSNQTRYIYRRHS